MPKNKRPRKRRVVAKTSDATPGRPDAGKPVPQKTYGVPKSRRSSISPVMNRTSPRGR